MKKFFMNPKFIVTAAIFVAAFVLVTLLFVKKPNVVKVKAVVNGSPKRINACTRCLRSGKVTRAV